MLRSVLIALLAPALVLAQAGGANLTAPTLGYLFDDAQGAILPILGVPGAAFLDDGLPVGASLRMAAIAPNRSYAVAAADGMENLLLIRLEGGSAVNALGASPGRAAVVAFSPNSANIAVYDPDSGRVSVWTGLPGNAQAGASFAAESLQALAISDDGSAVAAIIEGAAALLTADGTVRLAGGESLSSLAFFPLRHDLAAADAGGNQVLVWRKASAPGAESAVLADASMGIHSPVALAFSGDGRRLVVANSDDPSVSLIDPETREWRSLSLPAAPDGLYRAQGNAVFRVNNRARRDLALVDGDAESPRVVVIPARGDQ
jgi:WD40 repeat protein